MGTVVMWLPLVLLRSRTYRDEMLTILVFSILPFISLEATNTIKDNYLNLFIHPIKLLNLTYWLLRLVNIDRFFKNCKLKACPAFKSVLLKCRLLQHKDHGMIGYITKEFLTLLRHLFHGSFHKKTSWVLINFFVKN